MTTPTPPSSPSSASAAGPAAPAAPDSAAPGMLVLGISHATAPLDLLERLSETERPLDDLIRDITAVDGFDAAVVVSTCNRLEIYAEARPHASGDALRELVTRHADLEPGALDPHLYTHQAEDAVRHLFAVASGLDSVVVGEDQILGQVKQGLDRSQQLERSGKVLDRAVQTALRVGRRARNETGLNEAGRSLATAGLGFFERQVGSLTGRTALVIGAGSMAGVVVAALRRSGLSRVHLANRTPEKAQRLAATADGEGFGLDDIPRLLTEVDVVVGATAATGRVVPLGTVEAAMAERAGRPLFVLDLAMPHNIAPEAAALPGVTFVDLRRIAEEGEGDEISAASVVAAQEIVAKEVGSFSAGLRLAGATPILTAMRNAAAEATEAELSRLARRLNDIDESTHQEISRSVRRIVDKILHQPTVRVRELAASSDGARYLDALGELFVPGAPGAHRPPDKTKVEAIA